jgi:hypothetical protein
MKKEVLFVVVVVLLSACGGRNKMPPEVLQQKLDSVKALEVKEKLEAQGIRLEDSDNPLKMFYDSLNVQPLPITYTEEYVKYLPDFRPVPHEIVTYLNLEGRNPKAISLPESLGARMVLLAADESPKDKDKYSLWIYSLDDEYMPVDKLCLYALEDEEDQFDINPEEFIQYFSITSDYEIHLLDFSKTSNKTETEEIYCLSPGRKFELQKSKKD